MTLLFLSYIFTVTLINLIILNFRRDITCRIKVKAKVVLLKKVIKKRTQRRILRKSNL